MTKVSFRKKLNKHKVSPNMNVWCSLVSLSCIFLTLLVIFISHGDFFHRIFFSDSLDTGMDFFHSIEYTRGRAPYDLFNTLYPPLANMFFYILYRCVPLSQSSQWTNTFSEGVSARGTSIDLRVWQPTLMLFIIFILITSILFILIIQKILKENPLADLIAICMLFSYGMLYAYERGNIVTIVIVCCMFFVYYRNSSNKVLSELALLALAIAAGLKIYPALFGILLLYDKQYVKAFRTVIYGIAMFILPVFIFHEGIDGIFQFLEILTSHTSSDTISVQGYSFDKIVNSIVILFDQLFHCGFDKEFLLNVVPKFNLVAAIITLLTGFLMKSNWQKILTCCLAMLLYQSQGRYAIAFLMIPLIFMIKEEEKITVHNIVPFSCLLGSQLLLPLIDIGSTLSIVFGRFQICLGILFIYVLYVAIKNMKGHSLKMHIKIFPKRKQVK